MPTPQAPDPDWLDRMYNNRARVPDHMRYFERWAAASAAARASLPCTLDLPYGPSAAETLDVFRPAHVPRGGAPVLVFVHGGAFMRGERRTGGNAHHAVDPVPQRIDPGHLVGRKLDRPAAENLLDRAYYSSAHSNTNLSPGSPRAIRLGVTTRF